MSKQPSQPVNLDDLFQNAVDDGNLSPAGASIIATPDFGDQIQAALCPVIDDVEASEVMLVAIVIDNSTSITWILNGPEAVCDGQNIVVEALLGSKQADGILVGTWLINQDERVHPFMPLDQVTLLENDVNYQAYGDTPLYRRVCAVLGTVAVEIQRFSDEYNVPARAVVLVVTDGDDEDHSRLGFTADQCQTLISDMSENVIVLFMGIQNQRVDFHTIAQSMGIPDQNVLTPKNTDSDIRRVFVVASKSALRASQSAANFSQVAVGGFVADDDDS
jgi:uncharacterized protein YegL